MDETKLLKLVRFLAGKCIESEVQLIALRGLLKAKAILPDDQEFDAACEQVRQTRKEFVSGRDSDDEVLEEWFRKIPGRIQ